MALIVLKVLGWLLVVALFIALGLAWLVSGMSQHAPQMGRGSVLLAVSAVFLATLLWFA
jgi:hypothetical protein